MNKTLDELLKENRERFDFVIGKLAQANMKFALLRAVFKLDSPLAQGAALRAEIETIREGFDLVNEVLEKVVNDNKYTDNDVYTLMQKYKEVG